MNYKPSMRLESARLTLVPLQFPDANDFFQAVKESLTELSPYHAWAVPQYMLREAQAHVQDAIVTDRDKKGTCYAVRGRAGRFFGEATLYPLPDAFGNTVPAFTVTHWIRSSEVANDYAVEALQTLTNHAFKNLGAKRVDSRIISTHTAAAKTLAAAGFQLEATLKNTHKLVAEDKLADTLIYTRLA
jgi:RimJ/RimL family protein N-acetyltransferase